MQQLHLAAIVFVPLSEARYSNCRLILKHVTLEKLVRAAAAAVQGAAATRFQQLHVLVHENVVQEPSERKSQPDFGPKRVATVILCAVAE